MKTKFQQCSKIISSHKELNMIHYTKQISYMLCDVYLNHSVMW